VNQMSFQKGDYVRFRDAPGSRMGTLTSDADAKGKFMFRHDPRFADKLPDVRVFEDEVELCERPTDEEVKATNAGIKRG
jgi:hypothetical protein